MPTDKPAKPERWQARTANDPILRLTIPADAGRERRFETSVLLNVRAGDSATRPHHALKVYADGELQWQRRIPTARGEARGESWDGLEWRAALAVPVGRPLVLQAEAKLEGARLLELRIEADEI